MTTATTQHIQIDATGLTVGRIATQAADALRGKNTPFFTPNIVPDVTVEIINAAKASFSAQRANETHKRFSGYPGGLKLVKKSKTIEKHGMDAIFRQAIAGMLPKNRLRDRFLKNLVVTN